MERKSAYEEPDVEGASLMSSAKNRRISPVEAKTARIQPSITEETYEALTLLAGYYGVTVNRLVRDLIASYLDREANTVAKLRELQGPKASKEAYMDGIEGRVRRWPLTDRLRCTPPQGFP